jgi:hypothetical protein
MHQLLRYIYFELTLHVSDGLSVHHQEFKTVHTATGICQTDTATCLLAGTRVPSRSRWRAGRLRLKCDDTRAETRFLLSVKRTSPFISAGASVQSTTGSRGVRISGSNAGYTMFSGSVKSIGCPLHSPISPSLPLPCVTVCNHISTGL